MRILIAMSAALLILGGCGGESEPVKVEKPAASHEAAPQETAASPAKHNLYSAADFFGTTSFGMPSSSGHTFSPDGSKVLITSDETGVFNAYAVDISTGERKAVTESTSNYHSAVSYFPADERVLFTADGGGDELNHVWVKELDGSTRDLTATDNTKASFAGWSADGSQFYILSNERDPKSMDLYLYSAENYDREMVFQNEMSLAISDISPDGRWIAMVKPVSSADSNVYLVETSFNAEPKLITQHDGNISYSTYAFTPDSSKLLLATNEHGEWNQAWAYDVKDGSMTPHLQADWDVVFVGYSKQGKYQFSGINADASTEVSITESATGQAMSLPELPPGDVQNVRFSADESKMAFVLNSDTIPSDVFVFDMAGGSVQRLTDALNPAINPDDLVEATVVRYESFDGTLIPSIQYKPKHASPANKVPALVFVHGGPGGQTRRGYRAMIQHLVNHGYAVLGANNRGSSGYGKTFNHMDDKRHGEEDLQDIVWGRKYLESLDWVDGDKVGIVGGSYGGFMVAAALAFEPEAFDVGIDIFGVTNWVRTLKSIPPWWEAMRVSLYDEMGDPATDEERHRSISPLFHAANITKPLLVVQGANDPRVLQVESDELVAAARANGVPVEYVVFPDEGHGFRNRDNRITASDTYVSFLETHLKGNGSGQ
jgi:dipeptidyl aminopeptidase/acylaminoacyl peptidase